MGEPGPLYSEEGEPRGIGTHPRTSSPEVGRGLPLGSFRQQDTRPATAAPSSRPRWAEGRPGSRLRGQRGCHLSSLTPTAPAAHPGRKRTSRPVKALTCSSNSKTIQFCSFLVRHYQMQLLAPGFGSGRPGAHTERQPWIPRWLGGKGPARPRQETRVSALVWGRSHTPRGQQLCSRAPNLQLLKPVFRKPGSHRNDKPTHSN